MSGEGIAPLNGKVQGTTERLRLRNPKELEARS